MIVLDTDGNRFGKNGLDPMGGDYGWSTDKQGERKGPLHCTLQITVMWWSLSGLFIHVKETEYFWTKEVAG